MPDYTADSVLSIPQLARGISVSRSNTTTAPHQVSPGADSLPCHRCGAIDTLTLGPGSGPHFAFARCRHCGHFIQWLSTRSPAERQTRRQQARLAAMAQKPPSQFQLAYLAALGDDPSSPPANMAEACQRIDALNRGEMA